MTTKPARGRANLVVVSCVIAAFLAASNGCSNNNGGAEEVAPRNLNANYYQFLSSSTAIGHPAAQLTLPASGELFSENTKHFDLVPAEPGLAGAALASLKESGFALYRPAGLSTKRSTAAKQGPGDEIPGFKNDDFPPECLSMTGDAQAICVEEARRKEHASYHDAESLRIQLGSDAPGKIADLVMASVNAHLAAADKSRIVARLTDFVNDNPAHATFDAAGHDIFDKAGYDFSHAVVTDDSRGDVDSDGDLDSHSTLIIEVRKSLQYERRSSAAIDACVAKHASSPFKDEYVVSVNSFVHLDHLEGFRRDLVFDDPSPQTNARMLERVNAQHETRAINHAQDANLLKHVVASTASLPWSASEYMMHFQLKASVVSKYLELIRIAESTGDDGCIDVMRGHLNPHTVLITGKDDVQTPRPATSKVHVFYQVPERSLDGGRAGYCMRDDSGSKVAILDPSSGAIVPACEMRPAPSAPKFTEGACAGDPNHWAYGLSRVRTPRFFTAQLILTETLLHDQVADYWSIKWYQNGWKAAGQVVVKAAGFVINTAAKLATGQLPTLEEFGQNELLRIGVYFVNVVLPTLITATIGREDKFVIAGYVVQIPQEVMNFALGLAEASRNVNPTFWTKVGGFLKGFIIGFAIDRVTSTLMQITDSMLFEWQDYSNGSHAGCFNFGD